ncbi:MAG: extracellular solute-binding protein, partial [Pseudomonadota bacterium]
ETTPTSIGDFFDLDAFPGKRGLWKTPRVALEWALMADGVAAEDIYTVLATPEGQDRAFAKLETIKSQIVWWSNGSQPAALLESGEVAMSAAWNGRLYQPMQDGVPIEIVWDGQLWEIDFFGIPKGSRRLEAALEFIKYATSEERMTEWSKLIPYGPSRASAAARVDDDIAPLLPTSEANTQNALRINSQWWAENINAIQPRFNAFIEENEVAEERGSRF